MEEFIIPICREDLSKRTSANQYYVSKLVNMDSLPKHITVCEQDFRERGHTFIYEMFDYLYSVIYHWSNVDMKIKEKSWDLLLKCCQKSVPKIFEILNSHASRDDQCKYRNCLKMNIYLLCQMIELFENEMRQLQSVLDKGKGKKKKTVATKMDLFEEIELAINGISQLFQCKITQFWDPPVVEDDFVNLITNTCYKLLENPDFCKNAKLREALSKILVVMIKNYNHGNSSPVKLVQLLHSYPHMPTCLVYICRNFLGTENFPSTVRDILTEVCAYNSVDLERDSQASSSFSSFLTELAQEFPETLIPILPSLKDKLDEDPYSMRNCVLTVLGEIVIQVYSKNDENSANFNSLIEVIEDHLSDSNGFVRSKALGILLSIIEKCGMPFLLMKRLLKLLVGEDGAISDTSSIARKNAIRIITHIVGLDVQKGVPYAQLKTQYDTAKAAVEEMENQIGAMPAESVADVEKHIELLKEKVHGDEGTIEVAPLESQGVAREMLEMKLTQSKNVLLVFEQLMEIAFLIDCGVKDIQSMLTSRVPSDVLEAISFFVAAKSSNFNVDAGIRKMLPHICSKDDSIRAAITNAYRILYLEIEDGEHDRNQLIIDSLSKLVVNPTFGEFTCVKNLVVNFTESGDLDQAVIECIWNRSRYNNNKYSILQKKHSAIVFSMVANVPKPFMSKYFNLMINEGIPNSGFEKLDLQLIGYYCIAIQNFVKARKSEKLAEPFRLPKTHTLFDRLLNLCISTFSGKSRLYWITMANETINTIYLLAESPNILSSKLISSLSKKLFEWNSLKSGSDQNHWDCNQFMLTKFIDVAGHIAMKQFLHFDVSILEELKRRNTVTEEKDQLKKTRKLAKDKRRQTATTDKDGTLNIEEELGLVGATADDVEAEFIRKLCEFGLITDPSKLLNRLLNIVVFICKNASKFKDQDLQKIASLSLGKMMLISSKVCMDNIDLLFNLAARSPSESLRANLIVPLGDLIKRFTTKLEPYTPNLYSRLRDPSPVVRLNVLNVLSHLILNDMIKVKGQLSEMTTCIIDENSRIKHLSKIFFQELANKDKALYNVMPDIISRLSSAETGVSEDKFRTIMEYLMPFIQKKNQTENLFEKISTRLQASNDERSWRDLSFCLSLMPFNDTMLRALQFNLNNFAGKLHVDEVNDAITGIINNAKKNAKGEILAVIEEMSVNIVKLRDKGVEDEEANSSAQRVNIKKGRKTKKARETAVVTKHKDNDGEGPSENIVNKSIRKNKAKRIHEEDSDASIDDNQSIASSRQRRTCQTKIDKVKNIFSSDESDDEDKDVTPKKRDNTKRNLLVDSDSESE